jgi:hypothetical protein
MIGSRHLFSSTTGTEPPEPPGGLTRGEGDGKKTAALRHGGSPMVMLINVRTTGVVPRRRTIAEHSVQVVIAMIPLLCRLFISKGTPLYMIRSIRDVANDNVDFRHSHDVLCFVGTRRRPSHSYLAPTHLPHELQNHIRVGCMRRAQRGASLSETSGPKGDSVAV